MINNENYDEILTNEYCLTYISINKLNYICLPKKKMISFFL